jgi:plasmanylethanolamine desaturase
VQSASWGLYRAIRRRNFMETHGTPYCSELTMSTHAASPMKHTWLGTYDYPTSHRVLEVVSLAAFFGFSLVFGQRVMSEVVHRLSWSTALISVAMFLVGYAVADFLSGLVHFLFDNIGSPDTPLIGQKFIKPFRDHHDDPLAMTLGDAVAVNADNCFACLPVLVPVFFLMDVSGHPFVGVFLVALLFFTMLTNQLHKWAHMAKRPAIVHTLQRAHLVLTVDHHQVHHTAPFDSNYCITWGLLNPVLERIGFWPFLLRVLRRPA